MAYQDYAIPSGQDKRDYNVAQFIPGIDKVAGTHYMIKLPQREIIASQGSVGACVGYSLSLCNSIGVYQATGSWAEYSPMMLYGDREDGDHQAPGMRPSEALRNLRHKGMWFKKDFDVKKEVPALYQYVKKAKADSPHLGKIALKHAICGYARLNSNDEIKIAVKSGMPVTASWKIYSSFRAAGKDGIVAVPADGEARDKSHGSHQMAIIGWTKIKKKEYWAVANSWGTGYAQKGLYYIPFEYAPYEMWSVSSAIDPFTGRAERIEMTVGSCIMSVDGMEREIDAAPMKMADRVYLPVRAASEAMGASVEWAGRTEQVTIRRGKAKLELKVGSKDLYANGVKHIMDAAPVKTGGRVLLPVRFVAEHMGYRVDWDNAGQKVVASANG